ncbi:MAG TPA: cytochrome c biogenesis protein CcsA [Fibrobacteria bacterium]|nr:cytochrome c biogenesis protein CcsA [Fibrobacteria bacterium]
MSRLRPRTPALVHFLAAFALLGAALASAQGAVQTPAAPMDTAALNAAADALEKSTADQGMDMSANPHGGSVDEQHPMPSLLPKPGANPPGSLRKVGALSAVAILHEGRLKPMETFARHVLLQFSGRTRYDKQSALEVMARILFAPEMTGDYKIFLINNPEMVEALKVTPEKRRKYSFRQLEKSLPKLQELAEKADAVEAEKRDLVQKEVLRTYSNLVAYLNLTRTFSYALPSPAFTIQLAETKVRLGLPSDRTAFSFWDLMSRAPHIAAVLEEVGDRPMNQRSGLEQEVIALSQAMYMSSQSLSQSSLKVLPPPGATDAGWLSPPEALAVPEHLQGFHDELSAWAQMTIAYRQGQASAFDSAAVAFQASIENRAHDQLQATHFPLEVAYQKGEPFYRSLVLYWLALLGTFAFFLVRKRWVYRATLWIFLTGFTIHLAGLVARIIIMKRPPVTSLYETFPFVAAVALLAALFMERIHAKQRGAGIALLTASLLGVILMSIAGRYAAEGDTMRMLVAVLDSNFWLSTHVTTVTIGYSACLLAGAIGHAWMVRALLPGDEGKPERLKEISKMIYGTLCFGLLFSFIGTVLGGVWADQSWGRFWGWDPKENGALLIVIWCLILLHARHWGYLRQMGMALGSIAGAVVVAIAWFGVNLLNVGLHSYGFTEGAATKLFTYIGIELLFMAVTGIWLRLGNAGKAGSPPIARATEARA